LPGFGCHPNQATALTPLSPKPQTVSLPMLIAVDVYYKATLAQTVAVTFEWADAAPQAIFQHAGTVSDEYIPGEFYKRELPCLLEVLRLVDLTATEAIVVDGHVYVDDSFSFGLGAHLWEALDKTIPVIGVAKTGFQRNQQTVREVYRGTSQKPLFVSAIGTDAAVAAERIAHMSGPYRIPDMLKQLDRLTKEGIR
jgi:deoxyribonuclease V